MLRLQVSRLKSNQVEINIRFDFPSSSVIKSISKYLSASVILHVFLFYAVPILVRQVTGFLPQSVSYTGTQIQKIVDIELNEILTKNSENIRDENDEDNFKVLPEKKHVSNTAKHARKVESNKTASAISKLAREFSKLNPSLLQTKKDTKESTQTNRLENLTAAQLQSIRSKLLQYKFNLKQFNISAAASKSFSKTGKSQNQNYDELLRAFQQLQGQFRSCYEKVLLVDPSFSVVVDLEAEVEKAGNIGGSRFDISGVYTSASKVGLTTCLRGVLEQMKVSKSLAGVRFKNQIIFKM